MRSTAKRTSTIRFLPVQDSSRVLLLRAGGGASTACGPGPTFRVGWFRKAWRARSSSPMLARSAGVLISAEVSCALTGLGPVLFVVETDRDATRATRKTSRPRAKRCAACSDWRKISKRLDIAWRAGARKRWFQNRSGQGDSPNMLGGRRKLGMIRIGFEASSSRTCASRARRCRFPARRFFRFWQARARLPCCRRIRDH